ncbi:MAG: N,N-dimethylformamidase beta subunit family domain-containing protein [Caulobacteraceae bacterium]
MTPWPSIPRRILLRLAGAGLALAPLGARAAPVEGGGGGRVSPSTPAIWTEFFKGQRIWAYADRQSLLPGEPLNVMAAGGPGQPTRRVRLEVFRIGATGQVPVWASDFVDVSYRGATASAAAIGPGWPPAFANIDTRGWPSGCYSADIVEQTTATRDVRAAQWIVRNPKASGAVLVRLGTNTYQAYNPWGGHSLYPNGDDETRGLIVSFDRPAPPSFFEYDVYLVQWLEGIASTLGGVDYAADFDVHADPALIDRYRLVIVGAHDEYWSGEEFSAFQRRIFARGGNTVFFGANAAYCQIRYGDLNRAPGGADLGRQLVCYKTSSDPIVRRAGAINPGQLETSNFRRGGRRPETMLIGAAYQGWFEPASPQRPPYRVARTDLPLFAGTGWKVGDTAADVVGYEWDNRDPDGDGKRLWKAGVSQLPAIDEARISVLFRGEAIDADGKPGVAEATWFQSSAGAKVFDAGAIRWAWGLGKEGFAQPAFRTFNENLVRMLSAV